MLILLQRRLCVAAFQSVDREDRVMGISEGQSCSVYLPTLGVRGDLPSGYIVSSLWVLKQFARWLLSRYVVSSFKKYPPKYPAGTFWTKPLSSFQKNPPNYPAGTFWTNAPSSFKMYPTIYLAGSLWVYCKTGPYWEFIMGTWYRTC